MPTITLPIGGYADDHAYYAVSGSYPLSNAEGANSASGTKYAGINLTRGSGGVSYVYMTFDTSSIPENAVIKLVTGSVRIYGSTTSQSRTTTREIQLYSGATPKGSPTAYSMNGQATIFTIEDGGSWTRKELEDIRIRLYAVRNSSNTTTATYVYWLGGDVTIEYDEDGSDTVDVTPATFEVSENYGTYQGDVKYISDGSTSTGTWRANNSASSGKYVQWTFDKNVVLTGFDYSSSQSGELFKAGQYLQVSTDGSNWKDVGQFDGSSTKSFSGFSEECRYVRVYCKSGSGYVAITEAMPVWKEIVSIADSGLRIKRFGRYENVLKIFRKKSGHYQQIDASDIDGSMMFVDKTE